MRTQFENAVYVHCRSHVSALAIEASCKQVPAIRNLFDSVGKLTWFLGGNAKRKNVFLNNGDNDDNFSELIKIDAEEIETSNASIQKGSHKTSVPKFCATRWSARGVTLSALIAIIPGCCRSPTSQAEYWQNLPQPGNSHRSLLYFD